MSLENTGVIHEKCGGEIWGQKDPQYYRRRLMGHIYIKCVCKKCGKKIDNRYVMGEIKKNAPKVLKNFIKLEKNKK